MQQRSREHFNVLLLLSSKFNSFVTLKSRSINLPEDDADASKHVAVITMYKIF
jgi:hypothetical protein